MIVKQTKGPLSGWATVGSGSRSKSGQHFQEIRDDKCQTSGIDLIYN